MLTYLRDSVRARFLLLDRTSFTLPLVCTEDSSIRFDLMFGSCKESIKLELTDLEADLFLSSSLRRFPMAKGLG